MFQRLVSAGEKHTLCGWITGKHATACLLFIAQWDTANRRFGELLDLFFGFRGAVPMGTDESAFAIQYLLEFVKAVGPRNVAVPEIKGFLVNVLLYVLQKVGDLVGQIGH